MPRELGRATAVLLHLVCGTSTSLAGFQALSLALARLRSILFWKPPINRFGASYSTVSMYIGLPFSNHLLIEYILYLSTRFYGRLHSNIAPPPQLWRFGFQVLFLFVYHYRSATDSKPGYIRA